MNKTKVKEFVRKNKTKIIAASGFGVAILCAIVLTKSKNNQSTTIPCVGFVGVRDIPVPEKFTLGDVECLLEEDDGGGVIAMVNKIKTKDIGRLGEEFVKCDIATNDADVWAIIQFRTE